MADLLEREHPQILTGKEWPGREKCRFSPFKPPFSETMQDSILQSIDEKNMFYVFYKSLKNMFFYVFYFLYVFLYFFNFVFLLSLKQKPTK